jgi:alpha-tubulin suppressor-like RCC1 family protein
VLTWGAGQLGQLGRPTGDSNGGGQQTDSAGLPVDDTPREVTGLRERDVVACGVGAAFYNTYALCSGGRLWCAGENQNKQCGAGPENLYEMSEVVEVRSAIQRHN